MRCPARSQHPRLGADTQCVLPAPVIGGPVIGSALRGPESRGNRHGCGPLRWTKPALGSAIQIAAPGRQDRPVKDGSTGADAPCCAGPRRTLRTGDRVQACVTRRDGTRSLRTRWETDAEAAIARRRSTLWRALPEGGSTMRAQDHDGNRSVRPALVAPEVGVHVDELGPVGRSRGVRGILSRHRERLTVDLHLYLRAGL